MEKYPERPGSARTATGETSAGSSMNLRWTMKTKPFELQKAYAEFLKFIGVIEDGYVWSTRHLRWIKEME